ncbi:MBL fold metallo-hydrolase [Miniphocaeibacter massiliensis]|uniref:MBL fold metallo-hydrolase n=1 Tax=Miniphocaeibacter massiliensis TaxID=2041841 RepID=UPI000C0783C0|nr:MBL fold metallo-hydrolase [Miniphocaeibacter massiliensis]
MKQQTYKNLHTLTFPLMLFTNVYIWEDKDKLILIDTSLKNCSNKIVKYIQNINKPLTDIILTHAHDDHIGGLYRIKNKYPNAKIHIGKNEEELYKKQCLKKINETLKYNILSENNKISSLEIIETPGHTKGSISLYNTDYKILIAGDHFHSKSELTISGDTRIFFPFPSTATEDLKESIKSTEKLKDYIIDKMYCDTEKKLKIR